VIIVNIHATYDLLLFIYFYITSLLNDLMWSHMCIHIYTLFKNYTRSILGTC